MSFPMSSRFSDYTSYSPSPTTYKLPSAFDEIASGNCSVWMKPDSNMVHKCNENCTPNLCSKNVNDVMLTPFHKKPLTSTRLSLDPNYSNQICDYTHKSNESTQERGVQFKKPRLSLQYSENKENVSSPHRNYGSGIPRFKKNVTEGQAPSFMTRPQNIHYCHTNSIDENDTSPPKSNFNRHSAKRKSVKPVKRNEKSFDDMDDDSLEPLPAINTKESNLKKNRPFNVSYTIIPRVAENPKEVFKVPLNKSLSENVPSAPPVVGGAIPKKINNFTDDMKRTDDSKQQSLRRYKSNEDNSKFAEGQLNLDSATSYCVSKILKKDHRLAKELSSNLRNKQYYEIASEADGPVECITKNENDGNGVKIKKDFRGMTSGKMRSHDIFALGDCNLIFLVTEEFIDDEYDSYIKGFLNDGKGYLQVLQNKELYEMTKLLVSVYLEKEKPADLIKPVTEMKSPVVVKMEKSIRKKFGKLFNKRKKNNNKKIWGEIEATVRSAITELKGEFQREIYEKTSEKLDHLVAELKSVVLQTNENIGDTCERTTMNLISKLENLALKS